MGSQMKSVTEFESWLREMEHLGTISGGTAEKVLEFVNQQKKEIDGLKQKLKAKKK